MQLLHGEKKRERAGTFMERWLGSPGSRMAEQFGEKAHFVGADVFHHDAPVVSRGPFTLTWWFGPSFDLLAGARAAQTR